MPGPLSRFRLPRAVALDEMQQRFEPVERGEEWPEIPYIVGHGRPGIRIAWDSYLRS